MEESCLSPSILTCIILPPFFFTCHMRFVLSQTFVSLTVLATAWLTCLNEHLFVIKDRESETLYRSKLSAIWNGHMGWDGIPLDGTEWPFPVYLILPSCPPRPAPSPPLLLLTLCSFSPRGWDSGARTRTRRHHSQDPRRAARPIRWPPARRAPSPAPRSCPHDSLNIPLKHETLAT